MYIFHFYVKERIFMVLRKIFPTLLFLLLVLSSCKTVQYNYEDQVITHEVADITVKMTLLSEAHLQELFGKEENPFINYPSKFPRKYFFVFETEITTQTSTVSFDRMNSSLKIGNAYYKGANQYNLPRDWAPYYENDRAELHMKTKIKQTLKPDDFTVSPDNPFTGYLVFLVPVGEEREGTVQLPAFTPDGDEGVIEIPFAIEKFIDGEVAVPSDNTGIFAE